MMLVPMRIILRVTSTIPLRPPLTKFTFLNQGLAFGINDGPLAAYEADSPVERILKCSYLFFETYSGLNLSHTLHHFPLSDNQSLLPAATTDHLQREAESTTKKLPITPQQKN